MALIPASYDTVNLITTAVSPSTIHTSNTELAWYFRKYLFQKALSVFEFTLPEGWDKTYFEYVLFSCGYIGVVDTDAFGIIPQRANIYGFDVYRLPNQMRIANPLLPGYPKKTIGRDCALIKLQPNYSGILDLVYYYADMLALTSEAASMNLVNSKLSYVFLADNSVKAESFKKMFDQIASGNPAVVIDKGLFDKADGSAKWDVFNQNLKNNYITGDLMADMHRWMNLFNTEIGIPNANFEKSERLITDEVNANNIDCISKATLWLESMKEGFEQVKKVFPGIGPLDVRLRFQGAEMSPQEQREEEAYGLDRAD